MGWLPRDVRDHSLPDFVAAIEGHNIARGGKPPLKQDDLSALDALMEMYPDG